MTATFCRLFNRPSTSIPFPPESDGLAEYVSTKYPGNCLVWRETSISEDGLTKTYRSTWINLEELERAKEIEKQGGPLFEYEQTTTQYCKDNQIFTYSFIE